MIRQAVKRDLNQQPEAAGLLSSDVWFVWPGLLEDLPLLSSLSVLVFHQTPVQSVVTFSTADLVRVSAQTHPDAEDWQLLRDVQAYLRAISTRLTPNGHLRAWERFYLLHRPRIQRLVGRWNLPRPQAEDCAQEVWAEIIKKLPAFRYDPQRGRFDQWLAVLVRRKVRDYVASRAHESVLLVDDAEKITCNREVNPARASILRERRSNVREALGELERTESHKSYQVLHLRSIDGLTAKIVANMLGLTPEQVKARHHRMKRKLGQALQSQFDDSSCGD